MNFKAYEKMPQSFKKMNLTESEIALLDKVDWVVTEKVHGANFSFIYEDKQLSFGKRKALLDWTDDFFGFQLLVTRLENQVLELFEALSLELAAQKYTIYGELFGGEYPHPDVLPNEEVQAVQTGIYYSPNIEFCAFDLAVEMEDGRRYYLDYEKAVAYFEAHQLVYAKPLFIGKLNEALEYDIVFNSTIPAVLGLPEWKDNLVEGVVIKPFQNLPTALDHNRPILKIKNEAFSEEKKFHQAQKWSFVPTASTNSETLHFLLEDLRNYVTKNRLNNVLSKIGKLDFEDEERLKEIRNSYIEDVFEDFNEAQDGFLDLLEKEQKDWLGKRLLADLNLIMK